ncbi:MAG: hypothetical protein AAFP02_05615 [Bacteroidota bacterium]
MRFFLSLLLVLSFFSARTQESDPPWDISLAFGSYSASLAVPSFSPFHPGGRLGLHYLLKEKGAHRFRQTAYLGYFHHSLFQDAFQLYTETSYEWQGTNGLLIRPIAIGGGYLLSANALPSLEWDPQTQTYTEIAVPIRNQWMISIGADLGYRLPGSLGATILLAYRLQVQGVLVQNTVPVLAYSPLMLGVNLPLSALRQQ